MNIAKPLVSVIVATYRREQPLYEALVSLFEQSYKNIEIIVVDDNDDTAFNEKVRRCISEFSNREIKIKHIENHPNLGSAASRNAGIAAADGEYVTFLDDDDVYLPDKISSQVNHMIKFGSDYSLTDLYLYNQDGKLCDVRKRDYLLSESSDDLMRYHMMHHMTGTDITMFRREYLNKIGGFGTRDSGDEFYLICRAIEGGGVFSYLPGCSVKATVYTKNAGNLSNGKKKIYGERELYKFKKRYFENYDRNTVRYIIMRHYATVAFTYLRMRHLIGFVFNSLLALAIHPNGCLSLFFERVNAEKRVGKKQ